MEINGLNLIYLQYLESSIDSIFSDFSNTLLKFFENNFSWKVSSALYSFSLGFSVGRKSFKFLDNLMFNILLYPIEDVSSSRKELFIWKIYLYVKNICS
jgi:hypothetical protein